MPNAPGEMIQFEGVQENEFSPEQEATVLKAIAFCYPRDVRLDYSFMEIGRGDGPRDVNDPLIYGVHAPGTIEKIDEWTDHTVYQMSWNPEAPLGRTCELSDKITLSDLSQGLRFVMGVRQPPAFKVDDDNPVGHEVILQAEDSIGRTSSLILVPEYMEKKHLILVLIERMVGKKIVIA